MAAAEARALLDQLMGGDRNAPLPKGAALPRRRNKRGAPGGGSLLLPGKKHKSCYDRDVCPLYCAWNGVDVYELFVNTKSDIGPNPNTPDDAAKDEYQKLPEHEQVRLGFEYLLFRKLADLVQQCDRTVQRNQDKLHRELQQRKRQMAQKEGTRPGGKTVDYVQDIDDLAVEQLLRNQLMVESLGEELDELMVKIAKVTEEEDSLKEELHKKNEVKKAADVAAAEEKGKEGESKNSVKTEEQEGGEESSEAAKPEESAIEADPEASAAIKAEPEGESASAAEKLDEPKIAEGSPLIEPLSLKLGQLTMERQGLVSQMARILGKLGPHQEAVDQQLRNLCIVKSDITTDKTVCEVSGNFMSARDADERIAAHYAGKQYVGWKLVRDKFSAMLVKYGKYGPPPPQQSAPQQTLMMRGGPPSSSRGGGSRSGSYDRPRSSGGSRYGGGGGGGDSYRGAPPGGRGRRRSPSPQRWDRGGGGSGGGGRYDRHYDRGSSRGSGSGGGYRTSGGRR